MQGLHLTADLRGCFHDSPRSRGTATAPQGGAQPASERPGADCADPALLTDVDALRALCVAEVKRAGLRAVNTLFHRFDAAAGITGVVLLAESHLAVHTWPELQAVTLDVYVCNFSADHGAAAQALMDALVVAFQPAEVQRHALQRGALASVPA